MGPERSNLPGPQHMPGHNPLSGLLMSSFEEGAVGGSPAESGPVLVIPPPRRKLSKLELWRNRLFLLELIFVCFVVGILLIVAPWTSYWTNNSLLSGFPQLRQFLMYDFVRGLISGLGLADLWLALFEAIHYREEPD
ncbi:MAG TPA: hypothetical protein VGG15_07685 [Terriglobales bacterium]